MLKLGLIFGYVFHSGLTKSDTVVKIALQVERTFLDAAHLRIQAFIYGGGGGAGHPDPEIDKGGQSAKKNIKRIGPLKQKKAHGRIALKLAALLLK